jgi:hypothetical protein
MEGLLQDLGFKESPPVPPKSFRPESKLSSLYKGLRDETRYLCFSGGGMCGVSYLGGLIELYQDDNQAWVDHLSSLKGCSGCSIGALTAVLVAAGVSPWVLSKMMLNMDLSSIKAPGSEGVTVLGSVAKVVTRGSVNPAGTIQPIIESVFRDTMGLPGPRITFQEFRARFGRDLYIVVFNVTKTCTQVFSAGNTPHERVLDAVVASMSIPYLFDTFNHAVTGDQLCDGGVMECLPLMRTPLHETLAFGLYDTLLRVVSTPRKLFSSSLSAPLHAMALANRSTLHRIVFFDVAASKASDFGMGPSTKLDLIARGRVCMAAFVASPVVLTRVFLDMPPVPDPRPRTYVPEVLDPGEDDDVE